MRTMTLSFAMGLMLMLLTVAKAEDSGITEVSVVLFIIGVLLAGVPILTGKIIVSKRKNRLTKSLKSGKLKVGNCTIKRIV